MRFSISYSRGQASLPANVPAGTEACRHKKEKACRHKRNTRELLLLLFILMPLTAGAQEEVENKIDEAISSMVQDHPVRLGILRVRPEFALVSGYDSNAVNSAVIEESDYFTMAIPAADAALRLGHRGYFAVRESLNFVYYNTQTELRDIYNTTRARFVTGSRTMLLTLNGGYLSRIAPYNGEMDQPVQQTSTTGGADFEFALRRTTDLTLAYSYAQLDFAPVPDLVEYIPPPPDNRTYQYTVGLSQEMGRLISLDADYYAGKVKIDAVDLPQTDSGFWRMMGGVSFEGNKLTGIAHAGYGKTDSTTPGADAFNDFLIDADVTYTAGRRLLLGVQAQRRRQVSALEPGDFLLNTQFGVHGSFPLAGRFFIDGRFTVGNNDYPPDPSQAPTTKDDYRNIEGGLNFDLTKHMRIRGNGTYQMRDSNDPLLNKNRFTMGLGLVMEP